MNIEGKLTIFISVYLVIYFLFAAFRKDRAAFYDILTAVSGYLFKIKARSGNQCLKVSVSAIVTHINTYALVKVGNKGYSRAYVDQ